MTWGVLQSLCCEEPPTSQATNRFRGEKGFESSFRSFHRIQSRSLQAVLKEERFSTPRRNSARFQFQENNFLLLSLIFLCKETKP